MDASVLANAPIPGWIVTVVAASTVFSVMFGVGMGVVPREFREVWQSPWLLVRALLCVLVAVPAIAVVVTRIVDPPRVVVIGVLLMSIAPGAPVALRRSLQAGGHRAFAPALQMLMAILAVVSMPLSIVILDRVYAGHAIVSPGDVARQVFVAQLLPLAIGFGVRLAAPSLAERAEPWIGRLGGLLLLLLLAVALVDTWHFIAQASVRTLLVIVVITALAVMIGHMMGGPDDGTRTAVAIACAARNAGLALLVASANGGSHAVIATIFAYLVVSAVTVVPYVALRRAPREAPHGAG